MSEGFPPEVRELARSPIGPPPTRHIDPVTDEVVAGVPVRIYRGNGPPTGLIVYFHGGAFVVGSIGIMDNVAPRTPTATVPPSSRSSTGSGALQSAQNVYFLSSFEPVEMGTPATRQLHSALKRIGISTDPTFAEYAGHTSVALLVEGLRAAGPNRSRAALISALSGIAHFNAAGLFGTHMVNMADRSTTAVGVDNCYWITKLSGSTFQLVPGADPICGSVIPGKTVSPWS
jgi:hypothetical protein